MIDVAVIGAGLSGLTAASLLVEAGKEVRVIEARERIGGRIHSLYDPATGAYLADFGPTWVWPEYQPAVPRWLERLGLSLFPQYDEGHGVLDYGPDVAPQTGAIPGQYGIARISGGPQALIDALADTLPEGAISKSTPVISVNAREDWVELGLGGEAEAALEAHHVVAALPTRIAASSLHWIPTLPAPLLQALRATPTWMAPHAKAVALYDRAFWRDKGLSGRLISRAGPMVEAHDHCGPDGEPAAIFGFVGWPAEIRRAQSEALESQIEAQLLRCFGARPSSIHIEDWAQAPFTAAAADLEGDMAHPSTGPDLLRAPHASGRVFFAAAEVASESPGLIEGALVAAEKAVAAILAQ